MCFILVFPDGIACEGVLKKKKKRKVKIFFIRLQQSSFAT